MAGLDSPVCIALIINPINMRIMINTDEYSSKPLETI